MVELRDFAFAGSQQALCEFAAEIDKAVLVYNTMK